MLKLDTPFEHIMIVENSRDDSAIPIKPHKKTKEKIKEPSPVRLLFLLQK